MILDRGLLRLCRPVTTEAVRPGDRPENALRAYYMGWYGERVVGYNRYYVGQGAGTRVDTVVRIHRPGEGVSVSPDTRGGDVAILADGMTYRIVQAQYLRDEESGEDVCDLSLERIGEKYGEGAAV